MDAVQQLLHERHAIEEYARTAYASLSELRDRVRAEKSASEAEHAKLLDKHRTQEENQHLKRHVDTLQSQLDQLRNERDQASAKVSVLEQQLQALQVTQIQIKRTEAERDQAQEHVERMRLECELAAGEAVQLRRQREEEQKRESEIGALLRKLEEKVRRQEQPLRAEIEQLKLECTRLADALHGSHQREQSLRERLSKSGDLLEEREAMLRERRELAEKIQLVDQIEAELRHQQATVQKERDLLARDRTATGQAPGLSVSPKATQSIPIPPVETALMSFSCKNCTKEVQVSVRRAGLMSKCPHCGRIVPVPKR